MTPKPHPFISFLTNWPKTHLLLGILFILGLGAGATRLTSDFSYRIWFSEGSSRLARFDAFERRFGNDEMAALVIHSDSGIFDPDSAKLLIDMTEAIWQVPEVIRVDSLSNFNWVHADGDDLIVEPLIPDDLPLTNELLSERRALALDHPSIRNYLISEDGKNAVIYAKIQPTIGGTPDFEGIAKGMRAIIAKYQEHTDHSFYLTGNTLLTFAFTESSQRDIQILVPLVLLMTIFFLIFTIRRTSGVILPLSIIGLTVIATLGAVGWQNMALGTLTSIVPQFMIAISIAVVVHVLVSYYQYIQFGLKKIDAIHMSFSKNLRATVLTSLSTAIGFFSFTTSHIPQIEEMGRMAGIGALLSWLLTYWLIAPLLTLLPAPKIKSQKSPTSSDISAPSAFSLRYTDMIYRFRYIIMAAFTALCATSIAFAWRIEVNSDPFEYFDKSYDLSIANHYMEDHVGGSLGPEIIIDSGQAEGIKDPKFLNKVDELQTWINSFPFVTKTVSIIDILKDMNKNLHGGDPEQYKLSQDRKEIAEQLFLYSMNLPQGMDINDRITLENDALRLTAMWDLHESKLSLKFVKDVEEKAKSLGLNTHITGKTILYAGNNPLVVNSFISSMSLALLLVSILLIIGLRSFRIGLLSLLPNAIPLVLGASLLPLFGQYLDIGTVIVGSVCLGIAVDDTIHFLSTFRRQLQLGQSSKQAIAYIMTYTAPALITTTLVLVAAFATFTIALFVPNQNFGKFVAIILSIALITDLTFLPAMLMSLKIFQKDS